MFCVCVRFVCVCVYFLVFPSNIDCLPLDTNMTHEIETTTTTFRNCPTLVPLWLCENEERKMVSFLSWRNICHMHEYMHWLLLFICYSSFTSSLLKFRLVFSSFSSLSWCLLLLCIVCFGPIERFYRINGPPSMYSTPLHTIQRFCRFLFVGERS